MGVKLLLVAIKLLVVIKLLSIVSCGRGRLVVLPDVGHLTVMLIVVVLIGSLCICLCICDVV